MAKTCKKCIHYRNGECWKEGPALFIAMIRILEERGYDEEAIKEKAWFRPQVEPDHSSCKLFKKRKKGGKKKKK